MKEGTQHYSGLEEAVYRNIDACKQIAAIVRTSFGPNGMNKMVVNHLDKLFVTSDAATIIQELEVQHPAAKLLILASQMQQSEVGDGTNFVIMFAAKLLEKSENLLRMGLSPAEVIEGFELAAKKALEILPELVCYNIKNCYDKEEVVKVLKPCIASKQSGYEDFLAPIVAEACVSIMPKEDTRRPFNVDNVRVCKIIGGGVLNSSSVRGMVFRREVEGTVNHVTDAKVAVFSCPFDSMQTETKGTVLLKSADELKAFSNGEEELLESQVREIHAAGVKVVVSGSKFGDLALHFLNRFGIMAVKLISKHDLRRLCHTIGATALPRVTAPTSKEIGHVDEVLVDELGDSTITIFRQLNEASQISTVIVRGSTDNIMDDIERAVDDGVNSYKCATKDGRCLPGAGATEIELARRLASYAETCPGMEQYAITAFAESLEVVPVTLAENAGMKGQDVLSRLYAAHVKGEVNMGVDNTEGSNGITNVHEKCIWDLFGCKYWGLKFAANAAATVLRVDQIIMSKPAGGPKAPKQGPVDADDD